MSKNSIQAYDELKKSINTYGSKEIIEFIMLNNRIENMFHRLISDQMVDVEDKVVVYNLDKENGVLRFYYVDNNILTKVVLNKKDGTFNCLNVQTKPYLISVNGKGGDLEQTVETADLYYSRDLEHKITIENPNKSNIDFPSFISQLKI